MCLHRLQSSECDIRVRVGLQNPLWYTVVETRLFASKNATYLTRDRIMPKEAIILRLRA